MILQSHDVISKPNSWPPRPIPSSYGFEDYGMTHFVDMEQRIGSMDKQISTKFGKIESALEYQGEMLESDLQR